MGRCCLELAQALLRVALAWHIARSSTPKDLWVNVESAVMCRSVSWCEVRMCTWERRMRCVCVWRLATTQQLGRHQCYVFGKVLEQTVHELASQCSLHNAPIFRLLLKVAVNGTHQCESLNFCGTSCPNLCRSDRSRSAHVPPGRNEEPRLSSMKSGPTYQNDVVRLYLHRISAKVIL